MSARTSRPDDGCPTTVHSVWSFFSLWLEKLEGFYEERDRRYEDRFKAQETAVSAALASSEKLTAAAFSASKEAIQKAENAQNTYNSSHNDLTRKMDSQYKDMLPRPEADSKFRGHEEKIDDLKKEIAGLRESRSVGFGRLALGSENRQRSEWVIGLCIMAGLTIAGLIIAVAELVIRK